MYNRNNVKEIASEKAFTISILGDDIVLVRYKTDVYIELQDVKDSIAIYNELSNDKDYKILVEFHELNRSLKRQESMKALPK